MRIQPVITAFGKWIAGILASIIVGVGVWKATTYFTNSSASSDNKVKVFIEKPLVGSLPVNDSIMQLVKYTITNQDKDDYADRCVVSFYINKINRESFLLNSDEINLGAGKSITDSVQIPNRFDRSIDTLILEVTCNNCVESNPIRKAIKYIGAYKKIDTASVLVNTTVKKSSIKRNLLKEYILGNWKFRTGDRDWVLEIRKKDLEKYEASLSYLGFICKGDGDYKSDDNSILFNIKRIDPGNCETNFTWVMKYENKNLLKVIQTTVPNNCGVEVGENTLHITRIP